ncbi:MAG: hypoxanthine phosphoribosyltransferase, partial [Candidatus Heimdallarchaeota archaeon]|nr:hypoxanthine phosphoribosyltransferase [Candidatus Heimdallarchaeota archaeon]
MVEKEFISAQKLLEDSFRLGIKIFESGFKPNYIVGIWRGGTPVGIAVQELLDYFGVKTDHIAIRTSSYEGIDRRKKGIRVHGLDYISDNVNFEDRLLIVDDVFDTGLSIDAVLNSLKAKARKNTPEDIKIATTYFKPENRKTEFIPDYYIHETSNWLIFPHELDGLTNSEIEEFKPNVSKLI